jgi:hypothetical protein
MKFIKYQKENTIIPIYYPNWIYQCKQTRLWAILIKARLWAIKYKQARLWAI